MKRHLFDQLAERLTGAMPAAAARRRMSPELSYGRHAGPAPWDARPAAVMLLLSRQKGEWSFPLTLRPVGLSTHGGQVSLPGGQVDPGESVEQAALRELEEELGIPTTQPRVLGRLAPLYVFASNFLVTPVVAGIDQDLTFLPNPAEVSDVLLPTVEDLLQASTDDSHTIRRSAIEFRAPHFEMGGHHVWGATCVVLADFRAVLEDLEQPTLYS